MKRFHCALYGDTETAEGRENGEDPRRFLHAGADGVPAAVADPAYRPGEGRYPQSVELP